MKTILSLVVIHVAVLGPYIYATQRLPGLPEAAAMSFAALLSLWGWRSSSRTIAPLTPVPEVVRPQLRPAGLRPVTRLRKAA